jgi:hypothetical protein
MPTVDPELIRQLSISAADDPVEAVVRLRTDPGVTTLPPDETERLARQVVARTQKLSGEQEHALNVFKYLSSFAISAKPAFIKTLLDQPEVASALANTQPGSGLIPPLESRPAQIEEVGHDTGKPRKRPTPR